MGVTMKKIFNFTWQLSLVVIAAIMFCAAAGIGIGRETVWSQAFKLNTDAAGGRGSLNLASTNDVTFRNATITTNVTAATITATSSLSVPTLTVNTGTVTNAVTVGSLNAITNVTAGAGTITNGLTANNITVSNLFYVRDGANLSMGTAVLNGATGVTVNNTRVTASSRIFLTTQTAGSVVSTPVVSAVTANTSFVIKSVVADTNIVAWLLIEPGP